MFDTCMVSLQYVFEDVPLRDRLEKSLCSMYHTGKVSLQYVF